MLVNLDKTNDSDISIHRRRHHHQQPHEQLKAENSSSSLNVALLLIFYQFQLINCLMQHKHLGSSRASELVLIIETPDKDVGVLYVFRHHQLRFPGERPRIRTIARVAIRSQVRKVVENLQVFLEAEFADDVQSRNSAVDPIIVALSHLNLYESVILWE